MTIRDTTFVRTLDARATTDAADLAFQMDEEAFRGFYDRTSRMLWAYLARMAGDRQLADDLLQECYYRFLRVETVLETESHRRHYLFRIATNLVRDGDAPQCRPSHRNWRLRRWAIRSTSMASTAVWT